MGKEFEGYVYLVEHNLWNDDPTKGEKVQELRPALYATIEERFEELAAFAEDTSHKSGSSPVLENTFSALFRHMRKGTVDSVRSKTAERVNTEQWSRLDRALAAAGTLVALPDETLDKNPTVSPIRQQVLYGYLLKKIGKGEAGDLIPSHPLSRAVNPYDSLWRVMRRIHVHLEARPPQQKIHFYYAAIALKWMRGDSLALLIADAYAKKVARAKRKKKPNVNTVIREVFEVVEEHLRFRYVKFMKCYQDLLAFALVQTGREKMVEQIPALPLYLELGACSTTMVSLISLGLSRTTAGVIAQLAPNSSMEQPAVKQWLATMGGDSLSLSNVSRRELSRVVKA